MTLYFKHTEISIKSVRSIFTIIVLPEEMEKFKEFVFQYSEGKKYYSIEEAIQKAESQLKDRE